MSCLLICCSVLLSLCCLSFLFLFILPLIHSFFLRSSCFLPFVFLIPSPGLLLCLVLCCALPSLSFFPDFLFCLLSLLLYCLSALCFFSLPALSFLDYRLFSFDSLLCIARFFSSFFSFRFACRLCLFYSCFSPSLLSLSLFHPAVFFSFVPRFLIRFLLQCCVFSNCAHLASSFSHVILCPFFFLHSPLHLFFSLSSLVSTSSPVLLCVSLLLFLSSSLSAIFSSLLFLSSLLPVSCVVLVASLLLPSILIFLVFFCRSFSCCSLLL